MPDCGVGGICEYNATVGLSTCKCRQGFQGSGCSTGTIHLSLFFLFYFPSHLLIFIKFSFRFLSVGCFHTISVLLDHRLLNLVLTIKPLPNETRVISSRRKFALAQTCVHLCTCYRVDKWDARWTRVVTSPRKSAQVNASGCSNGTLVVANRKTCVFVWPNL